MYQMDEAYCIEQLKNLLAIDSTTSQYREIENYVIDWAQKLGYTCDATRKGGVLMDLGGEGDSLVVTAHLDDIGLMVRHIRPDGKLEVCPVGGLRPYYAVLENIRLYTRDGKVYTGSVCHDPGSTHVSEDSVWEKPFSYESNVVVVLDEDISSAADVEALGVEVGDIIAVEPRFTMSNGYLKSRFIDDKALAAILMTAMKEIKDKGLTPKRNVKAYFAAYEEIGHGTTWLPADTKDILALDIACVGPRQTTDEHKVTIFCKDSRFPYHYEMTNELRAAAIKCGCDYVMDIFTPHYGTDCDCSIIAGYDIRHAAIGPGTSNSHAYERTHIKGLANTYALLMEYMLG